MGENLQVAIGAPGLPELIVIGAIALLFFGAKRLPEFGKGLGSMMREFKKATDGLGGEESDNVQAKVSIESEDQKKDRDSKDGGESSQSS